MKKYLLIVVLRAFIIVLISLVGVKGRGQVTLAGTNYAQNFDGLPILPDGWSVRSDGTINSLGTPTTVTTDTWGSTSGNFRNVAAAELPLTSSSSTTIQGNSADRALGVRPINGFGDPGASFVFIVENTIGMMDFSLSLKHMTFSEQPRSSTYLVQFTKDADGASGWVDLGSFTTGGWGSTLVVYDFGSSIDNVFNNVIIRLVALSQSTGTGNRDTYGIDDFDLTWTLIATADYRSQGDVSTLSSSNWQYHNGTTWVNATAPPAATNNITINNGDSLTVNSDFLVGSGKTFTLNTGSKMAVVPISSFTVAGNANFNGQPVYFRSDATGTGRLGQITGTLIGATNVTVERFISGIGKYQNSGAYNRAYRLLAPSVNTTTSINANWQEGQTNPDATTNSNIVPGYGTHITGAGGSANGFDPTITNQASLYGYDSIAQSWVVFTNTNSTLLGAKRGYMLYIRGDRSIDMTSTVNPLPATNTLLRARGTLLTGPQTYSGLLGASAHNLITNPYASPINWASLHGANSSFANYYNFWDPNQGTRGGYVTVDVAGNVSAGDATIDIQSGQAFFVYNASPGTHSFEINENNKSSGNHSNVFRTGSMEKFRTSLYFTDANGRTLADGVLNIYDDAFSNSVDVLDALQIENWDEDIYIRRSNKQISIEKRSLISGADTIFLGLTRMKQQTYQWQFEGSNFTAPGLQAFLEDKYLANKVPINIEGITVVTFTVNSVGASGAADRFRIVFETASVLPVKFMSVKAAHKNDDVEIEWSCASDKEVKIYEIERSFNGRDFTKAGSLVTNYISESATRFWLDKDAREGTNYYRIKAVERGGNIEFSSIVKVVLGARGESLEVYPNPSKGREMTLSYTMPKGTYEVVISNFLGQRLHRYNLKHAGGTSTQTFVLPPLDAGLYIIQLTGDGYCITNTIIKTN